MFFEPVVADWARIMSGMSWLIFPTAVDQSLSLLSDNPNNDARHSLRWRVE